MPKTKESIERYSNWFKIFELERLIMAEQTFRNEKQFS
jgi:hypothetical protein